MRKLFRELMLFSVFILSFIVLPNLYLQRVEASVLIDGALYMDETSIESIKNTDQEKLFAVNIYEVDGNGYNTSPQTIYFDYKIEDDLPDVEYDFKAKFSLNEGETWHIFQSTRIYENDDLVGKVFLKTWSYLYGYDF